MEKTETGCRTGLVQEAFLKEMPVATTGTAEVADYVIHFCGLECYAQWIERSGKPVSGEE